MPISPPRRVGAVALVAALAMAVAACGSSGGAASSAPSVGAAAPTDAGSAPAATAPTSAPVASVPAAATTAPTAAADITAPPASSAAGTPDPFANLSKDKDLEARLPDAYGGAKLTKISLSGADMPADAKTSAYLAGIGKTPADMSFAVASGTGGFPLFIALRVKGASEDQLKSMFQLSAQQEAVKSTGIKLETTSLDGLEVLKSTDPTSGAVTYFVVRGDTALGVSAATDAAARKAFGALAK
jgi:hypothetical protein